MGRAVLDESRIHPSIRARIAELNADLVREVQDAVDSHAIVVVGMAQNPFPRKARKMLDRHGLDYKYLQYGSYFSGWRRRNALKMWTGWPTFPLVFVRGVFVGGASDLQRLIDSGELATLLANGPRAHGTA